jgi:hypothetical protein
VLQDFLQGVFEAGTEATHEITGLGTRGEKRSSMAEETCITTKKKRVTNNEHGSSEFKNSLPYEGRCEVTINNIKTNETETSVKLSSIQEMRSINLNAIAAEVQPIRNSTCEQTSVRMQVDDRCTAFSDSCPDRSTASLFESTVDTLPDGRNEHHGESVYKGDETVMVIFLKCL